MGQDGVEPNAKERGGGGGQEQYGEDDNSGDHGYGGESDAPTQNNSQDTEEGLGSSNEDLNDLGSNYEGSRQEEDRYYAGQNTQHDDSHYGETSFEQNLGNGQSEEEEVNDGFDGTNVPPPRRGWILPCRG